VESKNLKKRIVFWAILKFFVVLLLSKFQKFKKNLVEEGSNQQKKVRHWFPGSIELLWNTGEKKTNFHVSTVKFRNNQIWIFWDPYPIFQALSTFELLGSRILATKGSKSLFIWTYFYYGLQKFPPECLYQENGGHLKFTLLSYDKEWPHLWSHRTWVSQHQIGQNVKKKPDLVDSGLHSGHFKILFFRL
jgi:hypothetical protein